MEKRRKDPNPGGKGADDDEREHGAAKGHDAHVTLPSWRSRPSALMKSLIIAIDGPSGVGKGTVARAVAAELGYRHVDSGAMYRAVAWNARRHGLAPDDEDAIVPLAERSTIDVSTSRVTIDREDITQQIRTPEIDKAAAAVARLPRVRSVLVARQRAM